MCYNYGIYDHVEEFSRYFRATYSSPSDFPTGIVFNAFGRPKVPVITGNNPGEIRLAQWGLIPSNYYHPSDWKSKIEITTLKDAENYFAQMKGAAFNVRDDKLASRRDIKSLFPGNICLIPASGFFEHRHFPEPGKACRNKIPYFIRLKNKNPIAFAGIFNDWEDHETGEVITGISIITTEANEFMRPIHNSALRMPAILDEEGIEYFLSSKGEVTDFGKYISPFTGKLTAHTVPRSYKKLASEDAIKVQAYPELQRGLF